MNMAYAQNAYMRVGISDLTPLDLVIKLYDGAINFLSRAGIAINESNRQNKIYYINKARAIVEELLFSLNTEIASDVAHNLQDLYSYILLELTRANAQDDINKINHVQDLLKTLRSAWHEIKVKGLVM